MTRDGPLHSNPEYSRPGQHLAALRDGAWDGRSPAWRRREAPL